jgi:PKD repeat protein
MANVDRISSLDPGYQTGDLSIYPGAKDSKVELYEVKNNAETKLVQSLAYSGKYIVVEDTSGFPDKGLINVGTEIVYYDKKTSTTFQNLKRGFVKSRQNYWPIGTKVANTVNAEPHNAIKDAIINIQKNVGTKDNPSANSLNGLLKSLEDRFLSPKPIFKAYPRSGASPLSVKFQNFSTGDAFRYLWDFGDGKTSVEISPTHTYLEEGVYTVKLSMITTLGAHGIVTKDEYITIDDSIKEGFYYFTPAIGTTSTTFTFIDQTPGDVISRYWIFGDGETETQLDPDIHTTTHSYSSSGTYESALAVVFADQTVKTYTADSLIVS